ncbi:ABC transporter substrate-binding protein [Corynebacterium renale]|uniref:Iron complex transport system substrate-binding protein n=1 Tax=Corynebacterium renale TaxID=1724 RepID=A0A2A9DQ55_9CORY|nr:ABC transporter substrate-binding protein [Corynebacterium renale]PFG28049.1 iron complex transport system substrate-binding protein [Corynebacterium renale]SQI21146.1 zinc ABC transport system substrate-binding protein [Corynebacterium renale]
MSLHRRGLALIAAATLSLSLAACSDSSESTNASSTTASSSSAAASDGKQITFQNCGHDYALDSVPEKVMLVNRAGVVPTLNAVGGLDNVHMLAGAFPDEYFTDEVNAKLAGIKNLTQKLDGGGHLQISKEEVVGTGSDFIIGYAGNVDYNAMEGTGVPIIEEPGFCGALKGDASWDAVWDHINFYGNLFQADEQATKYIEETKERLAKAEEKKPGEGLKVAVLYPSTDGSVNYAYGTGSMSHPIVESAGMENVFGDVKDRVFEVTAEEIIARNPDVIISLYSAGGEENKQQAIDGVKAITGINETTAGKEGAILPMLLYFAEPPSGLSIDGLEMVNEYLENR